MNDWFEDTSDERARERALDVAHSWLVQAPAGSGKTGLLIQRYLALLARVDRPDRIVAMTFTRKAAAEMRERVIAAIAQAQELSSQPSSAHDQRTADLARAALARDRELDWRLVEHPARLRIMTIDALAASIARQAPISAGLGALPAFVDDATPLYREAARNALGAAPGNSPHWRILMRWLDNDAEYVVKLLAGMLAARDRWGPTLLALDPASVRRELEQQLAHEIETALGEIRAAFPRRLVERLGEIAGHALDHLDAGSDRASTLRGVANTNDLPPPQLTARVAWETLAGWMLTKEGVFRKSVDHKHGFPPATGADKHVRSQRKSAFEAWLDEARDVPGLAAALHGVRRLPPERYSDEAWQFVAAALQVLREAAGALLQVFATHGQADFAEATLRALQALGGPDEPSDLLLALDDRLEHLLIDEFQDTSVPQLRLIERLTAGWQQGDGRTLFAVGDPMQSIYRFRHAEVRIFVEAQSSGRVGAIPVGVLELARNFRSQSSIVQWVNQVFAGVLGSVSHPARGEVAYRRSEAASALSAESTPTLTLTADRRAEATEVVRRLQEARKVGCKEIAILLRARAHATLLLPALRDANVAYAAVELEALNERLATRDLISLCRALTQPADRLAWLAVLRAPWCGLTLADLSVLVHEASQRTLMEALSEDAVLARLSDDGRLRARRCMNALAGPLALRGRASLSRRVRSAWLALGGPACAEGVLDRTGADNLFALLDQHEVAGDLPDFDAFTAAAMQLYANADTHPDLVQVMTLHRAKGLEFDCVILPGLDLRPTHGDDQLLSWKVRPRGSDAALLLAPRRQKFGMRSGQDPVHEYLTELEAREERAELGRLLYVGSTRARRRLHLIAVAQTAPEDDTGALQWRRPARRSALERLWQAVAAHVPQPDNAATAEPDLDIDDDAEALRETPAPRADPLRRLPVDWSLPACPSPIVAPSAPLREVSQVVFDWADVTAAGIGTVAHRVLAQIAAEGIDAWDAGRVQSLRPRLIQELALVGVEAGERERAADRVYEALVRTLGDARGRWLFDPGHVDAHSEWSLAGVDDGAVVHVVVDRSFVSDGERWIVDYKTGRHEGGDASAFLDREVERYRAQLERYARVVSALDARRIRLALYYPLVEGGWREVLAGDKRDRP
ncbi:MAG TPA: UvrD-helicase domain-containing protein [Casimicrobiaceae bacterium]|nr:UvrD-helicase domain-containing protein [Casimicrobiaceae bacterium]